MRHLRGWRNLGWGQLVSSWICSPLNEVPFRTFAWALAPKILEIGLPRPRMTWSFLQDLSRAVSRFSWGPVAGNHRQLWIDLRLILRRGRPISNIFGAKAHANVLKGTFSTDCKSNCIRIDALSAFWLAQLVGFLYFLPSFSSAVGNVYEWLTLKVMPHIDCRMASKILQ